TTRKAELDADNKITLTTKTDIELSNAKRKSLGIGTTQEDIKQIRETWADLANKALERAGYREKIDHRSYADQNNGLQATIHEGTSVTQLRRKGIGTEISRYNDKVKQHNAQYLNQKEQHKETTLQRGFNRVEQGFDQWQKDQEAKRLELERQAEKQREMKRAEQKASPNLNKGGWSR
ncbi:MobA/MobL family protein, partial [Acinetobacter sp. YH16053]|uniref:MobA/MobL family protein n=1 Tax=Acinetobacter sp. YH16053 TaxID=2601192 RepID=UPI0015D32C04